MTYFKEKIEPVRWTIFQIFRYKNQKRKKCHKIKKSVFSKIKSFISFANPKLHEE